MSGKSRRDNRGMLRHPPHSYFVDTSSLISREVVTPGRKLLVSTVVFEPKT